MADKMTVEWCVAECREQDEISLDAEYSKFMNKTAGHLEILSAECEELYSICMEYAIVAGELSKGIAQSDPLMEQLKDVAFRFVSVGLGAEHRDGRLAALERAAALESRLQEIGDLAASCRTGPGLREAMA